MMQAMMETLFDVCYLVGVVTAGFVMYTRGGQNASVKKFGLMAMLLGAGDAFHLVPRVVRCGRRGWRQTPRRWG